MSDSVALRYLQRAESCVECRKPITGPFDGIDHPQTHDECAIRLRVVRGQKASVQMFSDHFEHPGALEHLVKEQNAIETMVKRRSAHVMAKRKQWLNFLRTLHGW